ncbi:MAG: saccharopine dehydrogenase NADP-binding domain-containing protein [Planctomycetes bacterium]|nr:saccharopine dehydrogenase NADP-binding domain-containing protein [Planctomycetota bacterium]
MSRAVVLGAGMVGSVMATDLATDFDVTLADLRQENLDKAAARAAHAKVDKRLRTVTADLSDSKAIGSLIADLGPTDIVVGALSSHLGFAALRTVIEKGKNYCDISFMGEDAPDLSTLAKERGSTCIVDMGVAPGMSHLLAAHGARQLASCDSIAIYVGGLPRERKMPFQYKAGFAPADVIEEYTRPTRLVRHGRIETAEALSEPEFLDFAELGTLEAVNTDGLRSLVYTHSVPNMKEKTLRYPGHYDLMRVFKAAGLFSKEPVAVPALNGKVMVRPLDATSAVLFPQWTYVPGEEDLTVMRITASGVAHHGARRMLTWDLFDRYHVPTQATSMSRTTAFPCTITARLIASGKLTSIGPGVHPPETLATVLGITDHILAELARRGVNYTHSAQD